uniref:Smr domain-containing protein n=1 Tax=Kalanchoe fedtschenkoi TaxID=63787 RepID=A0A7N0VAK2_KALFE
MILLHIVIKARPSYSLVDKSPANELDTEVLLHSMRMKPVHVESVYNQSLTRRQERMIDVQDLHVTDAIHVLNHELSTIRSAARASDQTLPVCICVGPDSQSFTPAKLPAAIRRYLLEEERLDYSELQPGLLRVLIC